MLCMPQFLSIQLSKDQMKLEIGTMTFTERGLPWKTLRLGNIIFNFVKDQSGKQILASSFLHWKGTDARYLT